MPKYLPFDGRRVSGRWHTVLTAARQAGVDFTLTSGHRTMSEQWVLYRAWRAGHGNLAAFPSPWAPHIRVGRADHAIDVNALDGGEARLERWVERQGADWKNTVPGEAWHGELSATDLKRLAEKFKGPRTLRPRTRGKAVRRARWLLSKIPGYAVPTKVGKGFYGPRMVRSVKRLQRQHGLKPDGVIGPKTWSLLERKAKR